VTLPVLWGPRRAAWFVVPFLVVPYLAFPALAAAGLLGGGAGAWACVGLPLAAVGGGAAALLVRDPQPPPSGRPHPAWGLMYLQYTASHLGIAVLYASVG
jgi:4-hydroxybenzoate polyprenyltransferase